MKSKIWVATVAAAAAFIVGAASERKLKILSVAQAAVSKPKPVPFTASPYYLSKTSIFDDLPVKAGDSVFIGDSITALAELQELYGSGRVKNRGINGDTTGGVLSRLHQVYGAKPAAVFLLAGINNLQGGISVQQTIAELRAIVDGIHTHSPSTTVYLQPLLPVSREKYATRVLAQNPNIAEPSTQDIAVINAELRKIATKPGIQFVPLDALLDADGRLKSEYTEDGLHLNGAGLRAWATVIRGVGAAHL